MQDYHEREFGFQLTLPGKVHLKANGKLEFTDLPHEILFFQGRPGILHPSHCMDIKWNSPIDRQTMRLLVNHTLGKFTFSLLIFGHSSFNLHC